MDFIAELEKSKPTTSACPEHLDSWNRIFANLKELFKDEEGVDKTSLIIADAPELAASVIMKMRMKEYAFFKPFIDETRLIQEGLIIVRVNHPIGALLGLNVALSAYVFSENWVDGKKFAEEVEKVNSAYNLLVNKTMRPLGRGTDFSQN
jgi:hypothetical protein